MKKKQEYIVEKNSQLLEYLSSTIKNKSKNNIKSLLKNGCIVVNEKVITKHDYELKKNDLVAIKQTLIQDKKSETKIDIIYEDDEIIVINKPAGLLSIGDNKEDKNTAYHLVMEHVKVKNPNNYIFIVHRLDRDTSGVLLLAKNEKIKYLLQENWNDIAVLRNYIAIVEGKVNKNKDTIKSWLKETTTQLVYSSKREGDGKLAITHYQTLKSNDKYSMLDIKIDTGRKNQIRVHMKDIGHALVGDKKYGSKIDPLKRVGLHACILDIKHPVTKKMMHFETHMPKEFSKLF